MAKITQNIVTHWIATETNKDLPLKFDRALPFPRGNHLHKMIGEYKGYPFPLNSKLALEVTEYMTEVDVEHLQKKRIVERGSGYW